MSTVIWQPLQSHPSIDSYWIGDRRVLQRLELQHFVFTRFYGRNPGDFPVNPIALHLSQVLHDLLPREPAFIGEQPLHYIRHMFTHPRDQARIRHEEARTPDVLKTLQEVRRHGDLTPEFRARMTKEWISLSLPDRAPDGKQLTSGSAGTSEKNSMTATTSSPINTGKAKPALTPMSSAAFALGKFGSLVTSMIHAGFRLSRTRPGNPVPGAKRILRQTNGLHCPRIRKTKRIR